MLCMFSKAFPRPHCQVPLTDNPAGGKLARQSPANATAAFTMVEILVATAVLIVLLVLSAQIIDRTGRVWTDASSKMEQFREARIGFDALIEHLNKATLGQYYGYTYRTVASTLVQSGTMQVPYYFGRRSELRFICGPGAMEAQTSATSPCPTDSVFFTAPLGITSSGSYARLPGLLNMCGYFVQWSNVDPELPSILNGHTVNGTTLSGSTGIYRFRLMQFVQPAENMTLYSQTAASYVKTNPTYTFVYAPQWPITAMGNSPASVRPVANNVVALLLLPAMSTTDTSGSLVTTSGTLGWTYDSQVAAQGGKAALENPATINPATSAFNRLPPVIRVVLYTIDEASAKKAVSIQNMPGCLYQYQSIQLFQNPAILYPTMSGTTVTDVGDLARFESVLVQNKLTFRRFEAAVQLPPQPWSTLPDF